MELLILIIHDSAQMDEILVKMMEAGIRGGTLLDCKGVLQAVAGSELAKPPVFSSLRRYLSPDADSNKLLLAAMSAENIEKTHNIVTQVTGGLQKANTGVFLTLPLGYTDGVRG